VREATHQTAPPRVPAAGGAPPDAVIGDHVLRGLGRPGGLQRVQVRRLWADYYRVNVFVGLDAASARVAHSYFLAADGDGNIVRSTPEITRLY
jgi:hypothetical protein